MALDQCSNPTAFRLRFEPKVTSEPVIEVPCDAAGQVDMDLLSDAERTAYFYARVMCHQRFSTQVVRIDCP